MKRFFWQIADPVNQNDMLATDAPVAAGLALAGVPVGEFTFANIDSSIVALVCHTPAPAPALVAVPNRLRALRDHLVDMFPGGFKPEVKCLAIGHRTVATFNHLFAVPAVMLSDVCVGFLTLTNSASLKRTDVVHRPGGGHPYGRSIDLSQTLFGAHARLLFLRVGAGGRGSTQNADEFHERCAAWVRYVHASNNICSNLDYQTQDYSPPLLIGQAFDPEAPQEFMQYDEFDEEALLQDAKRLLYSISPAAEPNWERWVRVSGAEQHLEAYQSWWLSKRTAWRSQARYWHALANAHQHPRSEAPMVDLNAHPDAWRWAVYSEVAEREPIDQRVMCIIPTVADLSVIEFLRQLSLQSTWTGDNHAFPGFLEVRVENTTKSAHAWYDQLVNFAAKGNHRELVVLHLETGVANSHSQRLARQITRLATTHKASFAPGSSKEAVMTQHVVVIMQPPCDALLAQLSHVQLWELRLGPNSAETPAVWHFTGQSPYLVPLRGRIGHLRHNPAPGSDMALAQPVRRLCDLENVITSAIVANAAPAGPVQDALQNLPPAAAAFLDVWFREAHARGVHQADRERADVFPRAAPY